MTLPCRTVCHPIRSGNAALWTSDGQTGTYRPRFSVLYFAESPIAWINGEPNPRIPSLWQRLNSKVDHRKIAPDDCVTPDSAATKKWRAPFDARRQKSQVSANYSNFSVINGNCNFALTSDLTVPSPTPQKRQQVCRTPRKRPLAALSDVVFRAVAISRRNSSRG